MKNQDLEITLDSNKNNLETTNIEGRLDFRKLSQEKRAEIENLRTYCKRPDATSLFYYRLQNELNKIRLYRH